MTKSLVTGATGFVGSAIARALLRRGHEVHVLVRQRREDLPNLKNLPLVIHRGDIQYPESLMAAMRGIDQVYHAAAVYQFFPWWKRKVTAIYKVNIDGTKNVLKSAKQSGIKRLVFTSSIITIGKESRRQFSDENTPLGADQLQSH